ncbi:type II toxin-antitoxin system Phd/YefM family antitoxin [Tellurirhabdus rosea]|uniref:type II toxin-antitoxin system Phd/YefM family antitoxin n=1 Tax=Tellurirhabdus rosea TaxID=2674997 RepID=UPI0022549DF7|nr:type II toxin-antitoxin system Phd/YefM family antitoxin [Tellurirhabdus rosea]
MTTVSAQEARKQFSDIISKAAFGHDPVIITRQGKEIAAIISMEELKRFQELEDHFDVLEAEKRLANPENFIPWEEARKTLGLDI